MTTHKIWRLSDPDKRPEIQSIDHVWATKPTTGHYHSDVNHGRKIEVRGQDCVAVATRIVALLNAEEQAARTPAASPLDERDRALIRIAMVGGDMGSMAIAQLYHVLGMNYGRGDFNAALETASRSQLNTLLEKCLTYLPISKKIIT
jgi:hypothetical protein